MALATFLTASAAAAQSRGPLVILGLRAPDGDDEAAANATSALRRAARSAGFDVPNDSPALEQSMASFGCDDSLPADCLTQIANDLHAQHMVYGAVRRHGHGASAQLAIQVNLFDTGTHTTTGHAEAEVARATAQDNEALASTARHLVETIEPPGAGGTSATTTTTGGQGTTGTQGETAHPSGGTGTTERTGQGETAATGPAAPGTETPVRRYAGVAAIGVGAALLISAAIVGIDFLAIYPNNMGWEAYNPVDPTTGAAVPASNLCSYAHMHSNNSMPGPNGAFSDQQAAQFCDGGSTLQAIGITLGVIGGVFVVGGAILFLTDHTGEQHAATVHRSILRRMAVTPVVAPGYEGLSVGLRF